MQDVFTDNFRKNLEIKFKRLKETKTHSMCMDSRAHTIKMTVISKWIYKSMKVSADIFIEKNDKLVLKIYISGAKDLEEEQSWIIYIDLTIKCTIQLY